MSTEQIPVAARASSIEYAIRDVVVPATALEQQGHEILKLNIGDPIAYPGLPTPTHMSRHCKMVAMGILHPMDCQNFVKRLRRTNVERGGMHRVQTSMFAME